MFSDDFISDSGYVFSPMFQLFIISVRNLDLLEIGVLNSLIVSHSLDDWDVDSQTSGVLFLVLAFISHMLMRNYRLVVDVVFLYRDVLDLHSRSRLGFSYH